MALYALTIFLSSFLLFQVQPIIAKIILPWFGGSAAVWNTCMLFFQAALLGGYTYAHWLQAQPAKRQRQIHLALLGLSLLSLPILPSVSWKPAGTDEPIGRILGLLATTIGLPYFLLSTTSPLLQAWYVRETKTGIPWRLFALSNLASMLALLGYPVPDTPPDFGLQAATNAWTPGPGPFAALIPCASRPEKLWPEADWVAVGQTLKARGWQVAVFWGSPEEEQRAQAIAQTIGGAVPPFLTVAQVADSLARAQAVVGLDTGMSHLAAAHGRPTVGIYCDHEPGLAGLRGSGPVISLGGKGQVPTRADVLHALDTVLLAPGDLSMLFSLSRAYFLVELDEDNGGVTHDRFNPTTKTLDSPR